MRFAVPLVLACGLAATTASAQSGRPPALLIHGNYCGPGNNAPLPPIDALDAACARHDACTPRGGLASPACNARLRHEADLIAHDPRQPRDVRDAAGFVAFAAGLLPSGPQVATAPPTIPIAPATMPVAPAGRAFTAPAAPVAEDDEDE
ncbi:hypothetical protein [Methylobacterium nonmethylotrophicum]|uniref:Phospholipase A2 domain-containing protein n=1 Tax=Methylobacterium nonmethylotrophicum TaxID=1141884 RepID=A0A4Z0ND81_9HYPH|nr:hypothetical protein [Methylobacterium nonmethylotrophicum]TGD93303.1 hypothetical protein EU555_33480 [Methylobacterium nonmethylotrophicum]